MAFNFGYPFNPERSTLLPGVPTDLTVIKYTLNPDTMVLASWNAPIGGDVPADIYELDYEDGIVTVRTGTETPLNAPPNVAVNYKVRSVSADGNRSDWTDVVTYTNVVPQTGVDTTTGQVDIAFTDATNTVYWDGTQFVQEVVVDTPIGDPELILNGTFDTNLDGWTHDNQFAWDAGTCKYERTLGASNITQSVSGLTLSDVYTLSYEIISSSTGVAQFNLAASTAFTFSEPSYDGTVGVYTVEATCILEDGDIGIRCGGTTETGFRIDNISCIKKVV